MELLELYNNEGYPTGKCVVRGNKNAILNADEHIAVGVIFIQNSNGEFLIQKTSEEKGSEFSSTGGHINYGESPKQSIIREVSEELGVDVSRDNIEELGFLLYDKPIRFIFYLKKDIDLNDLVIQDEEVESVKYMSVSEIKTLIDNKEMLQSHAIMFGEVLKYLAGNENE